MNEDAFGIRPGEVATELPENFDAGVYFIGRIRTPWTRQEDCPKNARESDAICTIEVDERWADALTDVESCSHLLVLYWMDRARRDLVLQVPRHYGEPLAVACDHRIARRQARDERMRQVAAAAVFGEAEECPTALAEPLHQAGLGEKA